MLKKPAIVPFDPWGPWCPQAIRRGDPVVWVNKVYHVAIYGVGKRNQAAGIKYHLSIGGADGKKPPHVWYDFQNIKNELIGPEYEAVEIYPPESELIDLGDRYHLWVFAPSKRPGFGFDSARQVR